MSKRHPTWVTPDELKELDDSLMKLDDLSSNSLAQGLQSELSVAQTRFSNGRYRSGLLATVLGLDKTMIPIRLSEEEKTFLLECLNLSETVKDKLK